MDARDTIFKLEETCGALGLISDEIDSVTGKQKVKFSAAQARNTLCVLEVEHSIYQGRKRPSVKTVKPHADGPGTQWQPADSVL